MTTAKDMTDSLQYIGENEPSIEAELRAVRALKDPNEMEEPGARLHANPARPAPKKAALPLRQNPAAAKNQKPPGTRKGKTPSPEKAPKANHDRIGQTGTESPVKGVPANIQAVLKQGTVDRMLEMQVQAARTCGRPEPKVAVNKPLRR